MSQEVVTLSFLEELAMMRVEEACPQAITRFDELRDKQKTSTLTLDEIREMNSLDGKLLQEYQRCKLHYQLNLPFMRQDVKDRLVGEVKAWQKRREAPN